MRKTWVWDPKTGELILKEEWLARQDPVGKSAMIMPDIADFQSPIDGSVVHGRRSLREHNLRHNVTNAADFKNEWQQKAKERAKAYTGGSGYDSQRRKEHIIRSMEQLRGRR